MRHEAIEFYVKKVMHTWNYKCNRFIYFEIIFSCETCLVRIYTSQRLFVWTVFTHSLKQVLTKQNVYRLNRITLRLVYIGKYYIRNKIYDTVEFITL